MQIAARTAAWAKSGYTAKDYVQDGLIAMWDGIENAGWGVHDPNATVWKDLVGAHDMDVLNGTFDSISLHGDSIYARTKWDDGGYSFVECCVFDPDTISNRMWFSSESSSSTALVVLTLNNNRGFLTSRSGNRYGIVNTGRHTLSCNRSVCYKDGISLSVTGTNSTTIIDSGYVSVGANLAYRPYGNIYSLRLYSRTPTASKIAANYAIDKARFNLT